MGGLCLKACRSGGGVTGGGGVDFHLGGLWVGLRGRGLKCYDSIVYIETPAVHTDCSMIYVK